ncbi:DUF6221 family protein [Streptomyces pseudovenezuelae]|uniref:DUF6221 family protein n=1 Tax=Streptomyces pseudovenezuelae TaxID=67350 RepID=UPI002E81FA43|nr:DUF6221 family protein [Streptomyces pseudovenezuelae]WUA94481.1 DUF6221 family protein [Streptomyces pseudovenezuelae]
MSNVDELVQFLNARLDEAEKRARRGYYSDTHWELFTTEAHLGTWQAWRQHFPREQWDVKANDAISEAARDAIRARITAHEADRTAQALRDIDSKRKLLEIHQAVHNHGRYSGPQCPPECDGQHDDQSLVCASCRDYAGDPVEAPCPTVLVTAEGYGWEGKH